MVANLTMEEEMLHDMVRTFDARHRDGESVRALAADLALPASRPAGVAAGVERTVPNFVLSANPSCDEEQLTSYRGPGARRPCDDLRDTEDVLVAVTSTHRVLASVDGITIRT